MRCPYCSEEIQADAKKCRHCGEWLSSRANPRNRRRRRLVSTALVLGVIVLAVGYFGSQVQSPSPSEALGPELTWYLGEVTEVGHETAWLLSEGQVIYLQFDESAGVQIHEGEIVRVQGVPRDPLPDGVLQIYVHQIERIPE